MMIIFFNEFGSEEILRVNSMTIPRIGETVGLKFTKEGLYTDMPYKVFDVEYRYDEQGLQNVLVFLKNY
jgi:hypothetical protein